LFLSLILLSCRTWVASPATPEQIESSFTPNDRLRITLADSTALTLTDVSIVADTIKGATITLPGSRIAIPIESVKGLERMRKDYSRWEKGIAYYEGGVLAIGMLWMLAIEFF
jgi:hypothetical protein